MARKSRRIAWMLDLAVQAAALKSSGMPRSVEWVSIINEFVDDTLGRQR